MASVTGQIQKLRAKLEAPVEYSLPIGDEQVPMNPLIGQPIQLTFTGLIHCLACGRKTNKSFSQGHCFPCFQRLARCDSCIVKPEQCHFFAGTCREPGWGESHCLIPHYVYLANTSGLKVGVTRETQIPTRWIDQGAIQALPIFKVNKRLDAGRLEVMLAQFVADKTNWRAMLKGSNAKIDLHERRQALLADVEGLLTALPAQAHFEPYQRLEEPVIEIDYPVINYPVKVTSLNFDKTPVVEGKLLGIKGQYLIFDSGVLNIRKFGGYELRIEY